MAAPLTVTVRPKCPEIGHGHRRVWMDGTSKRYSAEHRRIRWRCVGKDRNDFHRFTLPEPVRHPVGHTDACVDCDHIYTAAEGPRTGRHTTFTFREIADALIDVGRGSTYRDAAGRARRAAKRADEDDTGAPEANLILGWLDAFGSVIVEHYEAKVTDWPEVIALDSKPLQRGVLSDKGRQITAENGEILCAMDMSRRRREDRPIRLRLGGGKDAATWLRFFRDTGLAKAPRWILADQDLGIEKAVRIAFPSAILYRCEGHLWRNAEAAYKSDGISEWEPRDPKEFGSHAYGVPTGFERKFKRPPLYEAMKVCLWSVENWEAFTYLVETTVPQGKLALKRWILEVSDLVVSQVALRDAYPAMPRAIGSLEGAVLDKVSNWVRGRAARFRNRSRLDVTLGLMRLEVAKIASPVEYASIIRAHYRANGYRSGASWRFNRDPYGTSSITNLIFLSDVVAAAEREREQNAGRKSREARRKEEERAMRAAAGLDPMTGRPRRSGPKGYRSMAGLMVADFPDLLATWDWEKNTLDPHTTKASVLSRAFWACPVHESHRWQATIKDKAGYPVGCPYCMDRLPCPTNSVAAKYPAVAKEWHKTRNGSLTPDDFVAGSNRKVTWRCKRGHVWEARIDSRTLGGKSCRSCALAEQKERERATTARRHRRNRQYAQVAKNIPQLADLEDGLPF